MWHNISEILRYSKLLIYNISTGNPPTMQEMEVGMKDAALKDGAKVLSKIISELSDSMKEIHCRKCDSEMINIAIENSDKFGRRVYTEATASVTFLPCFKKNAGCFVTIAF